VIDGRTNTVTGTVPVGAGPVGVTVNLSTTTVYTANNIDNTVSALACGRR